jgi:hypothetical protein
VLACAVVICEVCEATRAVTAEARGQFGTPEERKSPLFGHCQATVMKTRLWTTIYVCNRQLCTIRTWIFLFLRLFKYLLSCRDSVVCNEVYPKAV